MCVYIYIYRLTYFTNFYNLTISLHDVRKKEIQLNLSSAECFLHSKKKKKYAGTKPELSRELPTY